MSSSIDNSMITDALKVEYRSMFLSNVLIIDKSTLIKWIEDHSDTFPTLLVTEFYENGSGAIHFAVENNHIELVKLLINYVDVNTVNKYRCAPLYFATRFGYNDIIPILINSGADINITDNNGYTPLCTAVINRHDTTVKLLIELGADVNITDNKGNTPIMWASCYGFTVIVKLLIGANANVNICDNVNESPLYWASHNGCTNAVKLLIDAKADVNNSDRENRTPLYWASRFGFNSIVKLLIDSGAVQCTTLTVTTRYGVETPIYLPMVDLFVNGEVKPMTRNNIEALIAQYSVKRVIQ